MCVASHRSVKLAADGLATGFLDLGLSPGDTILAWLPADSADLVSPQLERDISICVRFV